jgi:hypothetical protein
MTIPKDRATRKTRAEDHPARYTIAAWTGTLLRQIAVVRQPERSDQSSTYVHLGDAEQEIVVSFHVSGHVRLKCRKRGESTWRMPRSRLAPDGSEEIKVWQSPRDSGEVYAESSFYLNLDRFESYPACSAKPDVIFCVPVGEDAIGLLFFPMTPNLRHLPFPTKLMSTILAYDVLPPLYIVANFDIPPSLGPERFRPDYDNEDYSEPPKRSFALLSPGKYGAVTCFPDPETRTSIKTAIKVIEPGIPAELASILETLPDRPGGHYQVPGSSSP